MDRQQLLDDVLTEISSHTPAAMMRAMRRWPHGPLSLVHLHVVTILDADGPLPMRRLAEALDVSQASATGIVDRMEQRGLVERQRDPDDRRVVRVALAPGGRRLIEGVAAERKERLARVVAELSDDELEGFLRGSRALRAARERLHATLAAEAAAQDPVTGPGETGRDTDQGSASGRATAPSPGGPSALIR